MINDVYTLPTIDFVGGSSQDLIFNAYWEGKMDRPFGMTGCTANFAIISYINRNGSPIVSKSMEIGINEAETDYNRLIVELLPADTLDLSGKYIYQITIKDIDGNADIPQHGIIYIHNNINKEFLRQANTTRLRSRGFYYA